MNQGKSSPVVLITLVTFGVGQIASYFSEDRPHGELLQLFHQPHIHQDPPPGNPDTGKISATVTGSVSTSTSIVTHRTLDASLDAYIHDPSA